MSTEFETINLWSGEDWVLGEKLSNRTAILKNISLNIEYSIGDLVLFDVSNNEIQQVIKKERKGYYLEYQINVFRQKSDSKFNSLKKHFDFYEIPILNYKSGLAVISIPEHMSEEEIQRILDTSPVECQIIVSGEDDCEDDDDDEDGGVFFSN